MRRFFSNPVVALAVGLCFRLYLVLAYPADSGDTLLYEQTAANWLKRGAYALDVHGQLVPVDLRMPGYPALFALIYALTGRTGPGARLWIMLLQIPVDLLTCLFAATLAALLFLTWNQQARPGGVFIRGLWIAALCPFTANYTAVPLTEVFATCFTTAALLPLTLLVMRARDESWLARPPYSFLRVFWHHPATSAALLIGLGTLFRPETPLVLFAFWAVLGVILISRHKSKLWLRHVLAMAWLSVIPLAPWMIRNAVTLGKFQPLTPKYSTLPDEIVPQGFMNWERTWLYRFRDVYLVSWKLNEEPILIEDMPPCAFDTPAEKGRVAAILAQHNATRTLTGEEDAAFGQLAAERTARHPLRTYLWLPGARAVIMWFTPRIELLPFSGAIFPLAQSWNSDPVDMSVTLFLFFLNIAYVALAMCGAIRLWAHADAHPAVALLAAVVLLRTAFLTTLETPEPRYVLVCYPALLALAAQVFVRSAYPSSGSG